MPITQDRMIELIEAAVDYQQAYEGLSAAIGQAVIAVRSLGRPAMEQLETLSLMAGDAMLADAKRHYFIICAERDRFSSRTRKKNQRRMVKQALDRGIVIDKDDPSTWEKLNYPNSTAPRSVLPLKSTGRVYEEANQLAKGRAAGRVMESVSPTRAEMILEQQKNDPRLTELVEQSKKFQYNKIAIETADPPHESGILGDQKTIRCHGCRLLFDDFESWQQHILDAEAAMSGMGIVGDCTPSGTDNGV